MAESMTLAEKAGVDSNVALTLLSGQSLKCSTKSITFMLTAPL